MCLPFLFIWRKLFSFFTSTFNSYKHMYVSKEETRGISENTCMPILYLWHQIVLGVSLWSSFIDQTVMDSLTVQNSFEINIFQIRLNFYTNLVKFWFYSDIYHVCARFLFFQHFYKKKNNTTLHNTPIKQNIVS